MDFDRLWNFCISVLCSNLSRVFCCWFGRFIRFYAPLVIPFLRLSLGSNPTYLPAWLRGHRRFASVCALLSSRLLVMQFPWFYLTQLSFSSPLLLLCPRPLSLFFPSPLPVFFIGPRCALLSSSRVPLPLGGLLFRSHYMSKICAFKTNAKAASSNSAHRRLIMAGI